MDLSTLTRAQLVNQLLAPLVRLALVNPTRVEDAEGEYELKGDRANVLRHKLAIARELLMRDLNAQLSRGPVIDSPQVLREWLVLHFAGKEYESFVVLYLNSQHRLLEATEMFKGTLAQTAVHPREVVKAALARNAAAVILAHNHPSGHAEPSRADEYVTQQLRSALCLVDIRVLDHVVVAGDKVVSFAERGLV